MLNYIKSELYRASHSPEIRETAFVLTGLVFLMNFILFCMKNLAHFRYGITSFSYSMIVASPMLYCYVAADVAAMLYESDKRNGTMKNNISFGFSRAELFVGKCIVSLVTSFAILLLILPVYIGSALLLLDPSGPTTIKDMLLEIPAVSLIAVASLVLAVLLLELFDKSILSILTWLLLMVFLPMLLLLGGMFLSPETDWLLHIALWMPRNFFAVQMRVDMSDCSPLWDTASGLAKCLLSGGAGILIFGTAGILMLRKKEY